MLSVAGASFGAAVVTKTSAGEDGLSTLWEADDRIALWAIDSDGNAALSAQPFSLYAADGARAFFTSTLASPMADGSYTYYAVSPVPSSFSGTDASFTVPSLQDGESGSGEEILLSAPVSYGALGPVRWDDYGHEEMNLSMDHLLHRLRFYCCETSMLGGEPVQTIIASFPRKVVGDVTLDVVSGTLTAAAGGSSEITVSPSSPVSLSTSEDRNYLTASILPTAFAEDEEMDVTLYTETKIARVSIPLRGRSFAAGHSTAVRVIPESVGNVYRLYFNLSSNNLGEDIQTLTLTAPEGCKWGDELSNVYEYAPGGEFSAGESFLLQFEDEAAFRSLSGQTVTATYDSEHATISEQIVIGDLSSAYSASVDLNVPYLLFEDFSTVGTFSSNDEYTGGFNSGSKDAYSFLDGWTGARIGAEAGHCIRIACRRETSANYSARVDSAPIAGTLKSSVDLSVEFDYGANNKYGGLALISDPDVGQTCHIGYVTSSDGFKSGATDGSFEDANSFYVKEYTGSYTSTPNTASYTVHGAPAGDAFRLTIRTVIESNAGTTNTTDWLYIDNVKIKIAK